MFDLELWFSALWDVLRTDDEACLGLIRSAGGVPDHVPLVEGDTDAADALAYARTLVELGFVAEAREVLGEVLKAAFAGWTPTAPTRVDLVDAPAWA